MWLLIGWNVNLADKFGQPCYMSIVCLSSITKVRVFSCPSCCYCYLCSHFHWFTLGYCVYCCFCMSKSLGHLWGFVSCPFFLVLLPFLALNFSLLHNFTLCLYSSPPARYTALCCAVVLARCPIPPLPSPSPFLPSLQMLSPPPHFLPSTPPYPPPPCLLISQSSQSQTRGYAKPWLAHSKTPTPSKCQSCPEHGHTPGHEVTHCLPSPKSPNTLTEKSLKRKRVCVILANRNVKAADPQSFSQINSNLRDFRILNQKTNCVICSV